ncbi:TPA: YPDG domain-containing protein, partial [Streptococcus suis]|nr:YPDG domain-containing protein [Streptococcus suis]
MERKRPKKFDWYNAKQRFSIRKYHCGAASVLLGVSLALSGGMEVSALTMDTAPSNSVAETISLSTDKTEVSTDATTSTDTTATDAVSSKDVVERATKIDYTVEYQDETGTAVATVAKSVSLTTKDSIAIAVVTETAELPEGYQLAANEVATINSGVVEGGSAKIVFKVVKQAAETASVTTSTLPIDTAISTSSAVPAEFKARAATEPATIEDVKHLLAQVSSEAAVLASQGERLVATTEFNNSLLKTAVTNARLVAKESDLLLANSAATVEQLYKQIDSVRTNVEALAVELRKFSPDGLITAKLDASAPELPINVMVDNKGIKSVTSQYLGKDSEGLDMIKWTITHDSKPGKHWQYILIATSDKFNNTSTSDIKVTNGNTFEGRQALRFYEWQGTLGYMNLSPLGSYFGTENGSGFYTNEKPGPGAGANRAILWDNSWRNETQSDYVIEVITHGPNHTLYVRSASSTSQVRTEALLRFPSETGNTDWDDTLAALPENQRTGANKIVNNDGFLKAPIVKYPSVVANDGGSVTVTPSREAGDDANRVEFSYTDESNVNRIVTITKDSNGRWFVPASSGLTANPTTGAVTIPGDSVKDSSIVSATAKDHFNNQAGPVTAVAKNDPAPVNIPSTATDKQTLFLFNNTAIATVANGTATPDNVNKVKIATIADREGIKSVAIAGGSLGYTIDTAGFALGTPSVVTLGKYSRSLNVTDNQDQVTNVLTDMYSTYVIDTAVSGPINKTVGQTVTEAEILNQVSINPGNESTVINDTTNPKFRKVLAPGQTVPTTAGHHEVIVRVITDSNVYKDVKVTVVLKETVNPVNITDFKEGDRSVELVPKSDVDQIFVGVQGKSVKLVKKPDGTYVAEENVANVTVSTEPKTGNITLTLPDGKTFAARDRVVTRAEKQDPTEPGGYVRSPEVEKFAIALSDVVKAKPNYPVTNVIPGTPAISTPAFTDASGRPVAALKNATYEIPSDFKVPEGYTAKINPTTGVVTVTVANGTTVESIEVPVKVTYEDKTVENAKAKFQLDTDGDGMPDVTDKDDDNDGIPDTEDKNPKKATNTVITADDATVTEGQPVKPIPVTVTSDNPKATVKVTGLPDGLTFDPNKGEVTGTPKKITNWGKDEEKRDFTVTVEAKDDKGNPIVDKDNKPVIKTITITVQRDTDGDGMPDVTDKDDDNDGISDEVEKEKGTDPKVPNAGVTVTPKDVLEGQPVPDGTQVVKPESPKTVITPSAPVNGVSVDGNGNLVGTPKVDDWGKDEEEHEITIPVTVTTDGESKVVNVPVTIQRDTDGDGMPDVTDTDDDNDGISDEVEKEKGTDPKVPNAGVTVTPKDVLEGQPVPDGTQVVKPESPKTVITPSEPVNGVSVDGNGNLVGTPKVDDWGKDEEEREITIPVTVTTDGESKVVNVPVTIQRDTDGDGMPDVTDTDDDNDGISDEVEKEKGTDPKVPNAGVTVTPKDVLEGQPVPDGTQVVKPESPKTVITPSEPVNGVSVDGNGNLVGTPKVDDWGKDEEERGITIPVTVTTDGESKVIDVPVTIQRDTDGDGMPDVTDTDDDNDGISDEVEKEKGTDPKVPNVGIAVTPKDVLEGKPVPDGTQVVKPESPKTVITPSAPVNGVSVDGNGNLVGTPKVDDWGKDEEERKITIPVTVTTDGESKVIDVPVTIQRDTDGDGMPDVTDKDDDNDGILDTEDPAPKDPTKPNTGVTVTSKDVLEGKPVPDGTQVVKPESPKTAITPSAPVNGVSVDGNGNLVGTPKVDDWGKDEEEREIIIPVTVTTDGESKVVNVPVTIQRDTDGDGMPDVTDTDDDNDGISDEVEKEKGTDPKVPNVGISVTPKDVLEGKPVPDGTQVVKPESPKTVITPSTPVNGVSVDGNGNLVGTPKVDDWGKDEEERKITIPVTVTTDGESKVIDVPVTIQRDTDGDGMPDVTDTDDDNDGISDEVEKEKGTDPKVPNVGVTVTPKDVLEGQPVPDGTQVVKPESPKTVITPSAPVNGVSVDGNGNLVGTPKVDDWGKDEEEREITIPVTVTTDGESKVIDVPVTIQRDTDGDGMPDVTDTDDDNDGISDEVEKEKGTDPKVPNTGVTVTPKDVLEGQPVPDGTQVVKPESPKTVITPSTPVNGVSVDGNGNLVGTPKVDDWGKDEEEREITVPVTVTTDGESKVIDVPVTIQRDTDGDGMPDVTDTDDDNDGITDEVEKENGTDPKSPNTGVTVTPKDVLEGQPVPDGTQVVKPESPKTAITPSAPVNGVSVDGNGNLVGTPKVDDWGKDEEEREITIPVTVT